MSTAPLPPADGDWLLARLSRGLPIDGFDPSELPPPYPSLIAAALAAKGSDVHAVINAEVAKLPHDIWGRIADAVNATNPHEPRAALSLPHRPAQTGSKGAALSPESVPELVEGRFRTAGQMLSADLPPHRWLVDGLLVRPGLTILGGQPKVGKSWLALQLARAVALGSNALMRSIPQPGGVLYYVLEDGPSRLQMRLRSAGWDGTEDVCFLFGDAIPPLDTGGLAALEKDIQRRRPAFVVVDSLAAAKSSHLAENDGGQVAELMYGLARLCSAHDLSMLVVHHHRKAATGSPLADLRGSGALGGAADSILALYRERNSDECRLGLDSRDVVGGDWTLLFTGSGWKLVGEAVLTDHEKDQHTLLRTLQTLDAAGVTRNELIACSGMRRQHGLTSLKALVVQKLIIREKLPTVSGRIRVRYRLPGGSGSQPTP